VSALTEQNDLFLAAQRARRDGHLRRALADYDLLLRRYPDGPLAEAALVERMRLSRELRPARAVEEARDYLGRFPTGFGRREASEMLEGP
jgi:outer membrane protein assembly factor BamD (BamD/ComL family)